MEKTVGGWAFVIGLVLAIVLTFFAIDATWPMFLLVVLGLIVGILNITSKEVTSFLVAAIAFMLTFTSLSNIFSTINSTFGSYVTTFFILINTFIAPAAAVVAFKALFAYTKN